MNQVAIFFVPTNARQRDFETALREHYDLLEVIEPGPQTKTNQAAAKPTEEYPGWTWFLPNPRP